jgi:hypothetical protein
MGRNVPPKDPEEDAKHKMQFMSMLSNSKRRGTLPPCSSLHYPFTPHAHWQVDEERTKAEREKEEWVWDRKKREHEALKIWSRIEYDVMRNWEKKYAFYINQFCVSDLMGKQKVVSSATQDLLAGSASEAPNYHLAKGDRKRVEHESRCVRIPSARACDERGT